MYPMTPMYPMYDRPRCCLAGARAAGGGVERGPKRTRKVRNCTNLMQNRTKIWQQLQAEIAAAVGLHYASVSRIIKARREDENARYKT